MHNLLFSYYAWLPILTKQQGAVLQHLPECTELNCCQAGCSLQAETIKDLL